MLEILSLSILLLFGLLLILAEVIFVPGTTFVGLVGLVFSVIGIYLTFDNYGSTAGWIVLLSNVIIFTGCFIYGLKGNVWKKLSLNTSINSKFNSEVTHFIKVGDIGKASSDLRPIGNAEFDQQILEVKTKGTFVKAGEKVRIIKIDSHNIFVETLTN
jgi:membrane-bound ClpP family serine protease